MKTSNARNIETFKGAEYLWNNTRIRKLAANTYLVKTALGYGVKLYNTTIVEYLDEYRFKVNFKGWRTETTYKRIRQFTPVHCSWYQLGFKKRNDMPDGVIIDTRDQFLDYSKAVTPKTPMTNALRLVVGGAK